MGSSTVPPLTNVQFLLLLHAIPRLGEKRLAGLLKRASQKRIAPDDFLQLSDQEWIREFGLDSRSAVFLRAEAENLIEKSRQLARLASEHGVRLVSVESASYPARLESFDSTPPPILYLLGNAELLALSAADGAAFTFTIATSTGAGAEWLTLQDRVADELILAGGIPVTGHDRMAYQRLALSAQRRGRSTVYVLDRGLREALGPRLDRPPFAAARIRSETFDRERDLALSPFRFDDHGLGGNNRRRDELVFALADVVVAVYVRSGGAMERCCRRAIEAGRLLMVQAGGGEASESLVAAGGEQLQPGIDWPAAVRGCGVGSLPQVAGPD